MVWAIGYDAINSSESLTEAINTHWLSKEEDHSSDVEVEDTKPAV